MADPVAPAAVSGSEVGVVHVERSPPLVALDLHGLSRPLAHAAIRLGLEEHWRRHSPADLPDLVVITGKGLNSVGQRPVLRPEVQAMLTEAFSPPINSWTVPGNTGRLLVDAASIASWAAHTRQRQRALMTRLRDLLSGRFNLISNEAR
jgi:hypothetical protein